MHALTQLLVQTAVGYRSGETYVSRSRPAATCAATHDDG
jgi:hypothetical protein